MQNYNKSESIRPITERVIDLLRFPLIVAVVFIHGVCRPMSDLPGERSIDVSPYYNFVSRMLSEILSSSAVPAFFLISGFLFFYKVESFGKKEYLARLKSRFRTLLIPYLFWNLLSFAILNMVIKFPVLDTLLHVNQFDGADSIVTCLRKPVDAQFWFLKDLMVLVVLSPVINWIVTRTRHLGIILIFIVWLCGFETFYSYSYGYRLTSLFFFTAGAWCAYNKGNLHWIGRDFKYIWILWLLVALLYYFVPDGWWNEWLKRTIIILGVLSYVAIAVYVCERFRLNGGGLLAASSFFIYAAHVRYLQSPARKILVAIFHPSSDLGFIFVYFAHILLALVVGVLIYKLLSVLTPRSLAFVTGGRVQKRNKIVKNM